MTKASQPDEILVARGMSKSYGGVQALKDVTFAAYRGKVNVLVGENGAGKSTLMKILSGSEQPTTGQILIDGEPVVLATPRDAMAAGIGIIHQELSLFPNLSIAENMFAGHELRSGGRLVDFAGQRRAAGAVLERLGQSLDPRTLVAELPIGQQQLVEIGRVLLDDVRILIMDEPTSALSNHEVDVLFNVMADLRRDDVTVVYISHKLDEFRRIGDHVTVLRDGRLVAHEAMEKTDTAWIVHQMVGRDPASLFSRTNNEPGTVLLDVRGLTAPGPVKPVVDNVSFCVAAGEVVGIYGLMGAGRTELMECLIGARAVTSGEVRIRGELDAEGTVQSRIRAGLALVPEDRQRDGLIQTMSVKDNIILATLGQLTRKLLLRSSAERGTAQQQVKSLSIRVPGLTAPVTALSGGNQQKVVLGRALLTDPVVLLLDEPTRGVDVGAKSQIAAIMARALAARARSAVRLLRARRGDVHGRSGSGDGARAAHRGVHRRRGHRGQVGERFGVGQHPGGIRMTADIDVASATSASPPPPTTGGFTAKAALLLLRGRTLVVLVLLVITFSLISSDYLSQSNLLLMTKHVSINAILAIGVTFVILTGGIDLSVGSIAGLSSMIAGGLLYEGLAWFGGGKVFFSAGVVIVLGIAVGAAIGAVNGVIITRFKVAPFIATLGMLYIARGFASLRSNGGTYPDLSGSSARGNTGFGIIGVDSWLGVPVAVWIMLAVAAAADHRDHANCLWQKGFRRRRQRAGGRVVRHPDEPDQDRCVRHLGSVCCARRPSAHLRARCRLPRHGDDVRAERHRRGGSGRHRSRGRPRHDHRHRHGRICHRVPQ